MIDQAIFYATFAAAVGSGLVAGIFFAFSSFVMCALGRVPPAHGIEAMQAINIVVVNRGFMLAFFGTAVLCLGLLIAACLRWNGGGWLLLPGSLCYLVGAIGVTMIFNVPLNNALAVVQSETAEAASLWAHYIPRCAVEENDVGLLCPRVFAGRAARGRRMMLIFSAPASSRGKCPCNQGRRGS